MELLPEWGHKIPIRKHCSNGTGMGRVVVGSLLAIYFTAKRLSLTMEKEKNIMTSLDFLSELLKDKEDSDIKILSSTELISGSTL
jgi:Na+/proline symporter